MKILGLFLALTSFPLLAAKYKVDPDHSRIGFKVTHMMIVDVHGNFNSFTGTFDFDPKTSTFKDASLVVQTKSVNTNVEKRDNHLRTPDFFNVEKFPEMTFSNVKIKKNKTNHYQWSGDLSLVGVTKPVTFDLTFNGAKKDPQGKTKAGFLASGSIKRSDYGMNYNAPLDGGGVMISDRVDIVLNIEAFEE